MTRTTGAQARGARTGASASAARTRDAATPRTGAKRTVMYYIRQLPAYLRLLGGLLTDRRVAVVDKLLVAGAIAYIVIADRLHPRLHSVPGRGRRCVPARDRAPAADRECGPAGAALALDRGNASDLADLNLKDALTAAAFFLPRRIRRRLRMIGR